jgi:hypothetical protein
MLMEWVLVLVQGVLSMFLVMIGMATALHFSSCHRRMVLYGLPMATAIGATGIMVWMMFQRVGYDYELEWIEGGILQQVVRIIEGHAPYGKPGMAYVPALYAPLYYYFSAGMTYLLGIGLPALRAVSVMASAITACVIALSVWQLTKSRWATCLGFLAYSVMYQFTLTWFDVARVDNLWTMWLALTVLLLLRKPLQGNYGVVLAAACFSLAVFTKQASLFVSPFLFLAVWSWSGFRSACVFTAVTVVIVATLTLLMQWHSDGTFFYFTMQMAPHHGMKKGFLGPFLLWYIAGNLLFILIFSALFIKEVSVDIRVRLGWLALLLGFGGMSTISRMYPGGENNVLMPLLMLLTIMSVSYFALMVERHTHSHYQCVGLLSVFLAVNFYHGWVRGAADYRIPTRRPGGDDDIGDALVKKISQVPGRVCVTMHGYLGYMAGKGFCSHRLLLQDVMMAGDSEMVMPIQKEAREKLMSGYYQVIVIDQFAEINGLGVDIKDIPYTMTLLENSPDYPQYEFFPIVGGSKPMYWLEYNGVGFLDNSKRVTQ